MTDSEKIRLIDNILSDANNDIVQGASEGYYNALTTAIWAVVGFEEEEQCDRLMRTSSINFRSELTITTRKMGTSILFSELKVLWNMLNTCPPSKLNLFDMGGGFRKKTSFAALMPETTIAANADAIQ